jgi:hypothetical protein
MSGDEWRPPRHHLRIERTGLPLRGNPLNDLNQDLLSDNRRVQGARIFAATPPDFTPRAHCRAGNTQNDTKVAGNINDDPRNDCWKNKHTDAATEEWGRIKGRFPVVPPLMEIAVDPSTGERAASTDAPLPPGHGQSFETVESEQSRQLD